MIFEYFNQQGERTCYTEYPECVKDDYDKGNLLAMKRCGYKFKIDGHTVTYRKLLEVVKVSG